MDAGRHHSSYCGGTRAKGNSRSSGCESLSENAAYHEPILSKWSAFHFSIAQWKTTVSQVQTLTEPDFHKGRCDVIRDQIEASCHPAHWSFAYAAGNSWIGVCERSGFETGHFRILVFHVAVTRSVCDEITQTEQWPTTRRMAFLMRYPYDLPRPLFPSKSTSVGLFCDLAGSRYAAAEPFAARRAPRRTADALGRWAVRAGDDRRGNHSGQTCAFAEFR